MSRKSLLAELCLLGGLAIFVGFFFLLPADPRWEYPRFDSIVDTVAGTAAITLALLTLLSTYMRGPAIPRVIPIAFLAQALLIFVDSSSENMQITIWLNHISLIVLACGFHAGDGISQLGPPLMRKTLKWIFTFLMCAVFGFGVAAFFSPEYLPAYGSSSGYSSTLQMTSFVTAALFLIVPFTLTRPKDVEYHLIRSASLIYGLSALLFPISFVWSPRWWLVYGVEITGIVATILFMLWNHTRKLAATLESLEQTKAALERSNQDLERFASIAAHDLRSPLASIQGWLPEVRERLNENEFAKIEDVLAHISKSSERSTLLIDDLLNLARIESNTEAEPILLNSVLQDLCMQYRDELSQIDGRLQVSALPVIRGNAALIRSLFDNLIRNAINYRRRGQPLSIDIRCDDTDDEYKFSVSDNGIGIESGNHQRVFEMFTRLHSQSYCAGTGIGLPFCKRAVESHGGRIWLQSKPGVGSTFFFTLPKPNSNQGRSHVG